MEATTDRIIVSINLNYKNSHTFDTGNKLNWNRDIDNFDRKFTQPVNAIVIHSHYIPKGAELLCHHNISHDTYRLFDLTEINGNDLSSDTKYYSVPESQVYAWRLGNEPWQPLRNFEFGLRVYKPYTGALTSILPTLIKQRLFITTGTLKEKCVAILRASDYTIIFQNEFGKEDRIIRLRHSDTPEFNREEIIGIDNRATEKILSGSLSVGLDEENCDIWKR